MSGIADAVLFDLDGTLADTAPDLIAAANRLREDQSWRGSVKKTREIPASFPGHESARDQPAATPWLQESE